MRLDWVERERRLCAVLARRFRAEESCVAKWAREIGEAYSVSGSLEEIERSDRGTNRDKEALRKAVKYLRLAAKQLDEIGWHGGKATTTLASHIRDQRSDAPWPYQASITEAGRILSGHLSEMASSLEEAAVKVEPNADSALAALHDGSEPSVQSITKPTKTSAKFTARECLRAYEGLSGTNATVITKPVPAGRSGLTHVAGGPFFEFVSDVFKALELNASAETWARDAVTEARKEKSPTGK